jgi:integrase
VERWWQEAEASGRKQGTYEAYRATMSRLVAFLGHDDAARLTPEDVVRFKDHRLAEVNPRTKRRIAPKTVKESDLAGLKSVFRWAVANKLLPSNPAEGITLKLGKPPRLRSKGHTDAEATALLAASWALRPGREQSKLTAAKKWVPWLCAHTGARLGEMVQLRKEDLRREGAWWVLRITPEAGTVKTNEAREVVLHPQLVDLGFPAFVEASGAGHLFLTVRGQGGVRGAWRTVKNKVTEFARSVLKDAKVAPIHGLRHRFKTVGLEAGIGHRILDHIQGHAPASVGGAYGDVTLKAQASAIHRMPRYELAAGD